MLLDVKCAFLDREMKLGEYAELPRQDPGFGDRRVIGNLKEAMHGRRDPRQIRADMVRKNPSVYNHRERRVPIVVVHVGDVSASGWSGGWNGFSGAQEEGRHQ